MFFRQLARPLRRSHNTPSVCSLRSQPAPPRGRQPSQALPRQLSRRESQGLRLVTEALGSMRRFPAVLLPLPLRKDFPRSGGRCHAATKRGVWICEAKTERAGTPLFIRKGCCMKRCAAALWEVFPLRMPTKQRKRFSIYALRPARPLPALFSLRTRSFWCLRWLGVGWGSFTSPARLPVWAASGSMRSSVHS